MTTIEVRSLCWYPSSERPEKGWVIPASCREAGLSAFNLVRRIKGYPSPSGYMPCTIPVPWWPRFDKVPVTSNDKAYCIFAFWMLDQLAHTFGEDHVYLVPVPSRLTTIHADESVKNTVLDLCGYATREPVKRRFREIFGINPPRITVFDGLRWLEEFKDSKTDKSLYSAEDHFENATAIWKGLGILRRMRDAPIVIVDDVFTLGDHIHGCALRLINSLREVGDSRTNLDLALTCGQAALWRDIDATFDFFNVPSRTIRLSETFLGPIVPEEEQMPF